MKCNACPRKCNIDRDVSVGFCSCLNKIKVAKYMVHHFEEPIISGENGKGSGAIFFAGCNLKCIYCQNHEISGSGVGQELSTLDLVNIIKDLEAKGVNNINLVTPTHYTNQIIEALKIYKPNIPIVWNSSGYENSTEIERLKNFVDIYLVDLKYMDNDLAFELSLAKDYPERANDVVLQMRKNQPFDIIENGIMKKGVIVRHLVLPNCIDNSFKCLDWIKDNLGTNTIVSIMSQYSPFHKALDNPKINRKLNPIEYKRVLNHYLKAGFTNGYSQDLASANSVYVPDFKVFNV